MFVTPRRRTVTNISNLRTSFCVVEGIAKQSQRPLCCLYFLWQLTDEETALNECLEKVSYTAGVKITFSLMTNLKQGTLDMCKSAAGRCVCVCVLSRLGTEGLSFWLMCDSSTQLAFLCSCCCRYFGQCKHSQSRVRSVFI